LAFCSIHAIDAATWPDGARLFTLEKTTGEKPQSKIFHHDGSHWTVLDGADGLAIYEQVEDSWHRRTTLGGSGKADIKLNGSRLMVLVFGLHPVLHELDYDAGGRSWQSLAGFPCAVPKIHASESLVLDQDSTGRLWFTAEGDERIQVHYSEPADHRQWSTAPLGIGSGVDKDDISSVVSFGGDRIGVFWSDQNSDAFWFRWRQDDSPPTQWSATEVVYPGPGHADDHVNLAVDSKGRVFAVTKDAFDLLHLHRRDAGGGWTTVEDVGGGPGNRGIVMVDDQDRYAYILYSNQASTPSTIDFRRADLDDLRFGPATTFIAAAPLEIDDVTGAKQRLPFGSLVAIATTSDNHAWWNGIDPEDPTELVAALEPETHNVLLVWSAPAAGPADGYHVYRHEAGTEFHRITATPIPTPSFVDQDAPRDVLCYRVTAVHAGKESSPAKSQCIDNAPADPSERLRLVIQPNPFNPLTQIRFHLTKREHVSLDIYNVTGVRVATLHDGPLPPGDHAIEWSGSSHVEAPVPAGTYFLALRVGGHVERSKLTILK
jgi:hypothetical protein